MSSKYKVKDNQQPYFITITVIDWVDVFIRPVYKHLVVESLNYCQDNKGLTIHAYVIMSSHIHLIVSVKEENIKLEDIIRDFKKYTSKEIIKTIKEYPESRREWLLNKFSYAANRVKNGKNYKLWKDGFHPIELSSSEILQQKLDYIHNNPVEEEIVYEPYEYKYSSALDYSGGKGFVCIEKL